MNPGQQREFMVIARLLLLAILSLPGAGLWSPALAETRVSGAGEAVRLEVNDATVGEALAALGAALGLRYRTSIALDRRVTGVYVGPMERVVSRLLQGNNFIIKKSPAGVEVVVIAGSAATAAQDPNAGQPVPPWLRGFRQPN